MIGYEQVVSSAAKGVAMPVMRFEAVIAAAAVDVWRLWTHAAHIRQWHFAQDDWHCPRVDVDPMQGGRYLVRMATDDGSVEFDISGRFTVFAPVAMIEVTFEDGRKMRTTFEETEQGTHIVVLLDPELENTVMMQRRGWQSIFDRFKSYADRQL